jgi:hypothetical protein
MVEVADSLRLRLRLASGARGNAGQARSHGRVALRGADTRSNRLHQLSPGVGIPLCPVHQTANHSASLFNLSAVNMSSTPLFLHDHELLKPELDSRDQT